MTPKTRPVAIHHPSEAFRVGVMGALDPRRFHGADPAPLDAAAWTETAGPCTVVVAAREDADWALVEALSGRPLVTLVVLVTEMEASAFARALRLGADGVTHVDAPIDLLVHSIQSAVDGEVVLPAQMARSLCSPHVARDAGTALLNDRERRLLTILSEGISLSRIASDEYFSERTVRRHLQNAYLKLAVKNRAQAIRRASELGLLSQTTTE